jgi:hypothetical protein
MNIKTVGRSGQISLGKSLAGLNFDMEQLPDGDIILKQVVVVPVNEKWANTPDMKARLAAADAWMQGNAPAATAIEALEESASVAA